MLGYLSEDINPQASLKRFEIDYSYVTTRAGYFDGWYFSKLDYFRLGTSLTPRDTFTSSSFGPSRLPPICRLDTDRYFYCDDLPPWANQCGINATTCVPQASHVTTLPSGEQRVEFAVCDTVLPFIDKKCINPSLCQWACSVYNCTQ